MRYVKANETLKLLQICPATLKKWKDEGKIKYKKFSEKKYLYDIDSVLEGTNETEDVAGYCRVSTSFQKEDLNRQIELVKSYCISKGFTMKYVISDIASGLNENRKGLNELLNLIFDRKIKKVFITCKDRLSRFGFDYFVNIFSKFGVEIIILDETENTSKSDEEELAEDLISIIYHYSMKIYSSRRKKLQKISSLLKEKD